MQEDKDKQKSKRHSEHQPFGSILQVLELPAVNHIVAGFKFDILTYPGLNIFHNRLQVAVTHIHTHHHPAMRILSRYLGRPRGIFYLCQFF